MSKSLSLPGSKTLTKATIIINFIPFGVLRMIYLEDYLKMQADINRTSGSQYEAIARLIELQDIVIKQLLPIKPPTHD